MFLFSLASSRRLHQILAMYLFFTVMLVNVLVFAAPWPPEPFSIRIRLGRRVGTTGPFLSNSEGFAPDQQFVLFVDDGAYQYHRDTGRILDETVVFDTSGKHVTPRSSHPQNQEDSNFIKLGTNREQDIFIKFDGRETMTVTTATGSTMPIVGSARFYRLISTVEELQSITGFQITSDLEYVDAVFAAFKKLERADGTQVSEPKDRQEWRKIFNQARSRSMGMRPM